MLMEQTFLLKHHGHVDLFEQARMTGEERTWYAKRIAKEFEKQNKAANSSSAASPEPTRHMPPEL